MELGIYVLGSLSAVLVAAVGVYIGNGRRSDIAHVMESQLARSAETIRDQLRP